jgi:hypothetical protein
VQIGQYAPQYDNLRFVQHCMTVTFSMYRINNCPFQMYYRLAKHNQQLKMLFSHFCFMMKGMHYVMKSQGAGIHEF